MRTIISRWLLSALLIGWALSHAAVFAQDQAAPTAQKLRQGLDKTITVDFAGQTLADVLSHLQEKTGVPINLDPAAAPEMDANANGPAGGAPTQVKIKAANEKASEILRKLLNAHFLSYVILEDTVLVTSDEMATARQYLQRVNVAVEDVPFKKAVRDLAKKYGLSVMIDPKMLKQAEAAVSVELDNVSLETAIRMLAELADLKTARLGNVMFITSDERAKKIREEEQHQFDNPLNGPVGSTAMRAGMAAGAVGPAIRMMPNVVVPVPGVLPAPLQKVPPAGLQIQPPPPAPPPAPLGR